MVTTKIISDGLSSLGIRSGDKVLVHSSLRKFGYVVGGPKSVTRALLKTGGPDGTVLMPTLTGTPDDGPQHRELGTLYVDAIKPKLI